MYFDLHTYNNYILLYYNLKLTKDIIFIGYHQNLYLMLKYLYKLEDVINFYIYNHNFVSNLCSTSVSSNFAYYKRV